METLVHYGMQVQKMYEAFKMGDIAGIYHGPEDVKRFFDKHNDCTEVNEFVVEHILENEQVVVATGYMNVTGRQTGKVFSTTWSMTYEFNDQGQVVHFRDCFDTLAFAKGLSR